MKLMQKVILSIAILAVPLNMVGMAPAAVAGAPAQAQTTTLVEQAPVTKSWSLSKWVKSNKVLTGIISALGLGALIVGGGVLAYKNSDTAKEKMDKAGNWMKENKGKTIAAALGLAAVAGATAFGISTYRTAKALNEVIEVANLEEVQAIDWEKEVRAIVEELIADGKLAKAEFQNLVGPMMRQAREEKSALGFINNAAFTVKLNADQKMRLVQIVKISETAGLIGVLEDLLEDAEVMSEFVSQNWEKFILNPMMIIEDEPYVSIFNLSDAKKDFFAEYLKLRALKMNLLNEFAASIKADEVVEAEETATV